MSDDRMASVRLAQLAALQSAALGRSDRYSGLQPLAERFWAKVAMKGPDQCWPWLGSTDGSGRGQINVRSLILKAPRVAWYLTHGELPRGFVCHACDNPLCCNPQHLWIGDCAANVHDASDKGRQRGQDQTHCKRGHEFTPENTYWRANGYRSRDCKTCVRERGQARDARRKAARAAVRSARS